tara:strand:- start:1725 stop:2156 length:432 start_codon:yes stop_codon:yes gene_type:complete
MTTQLRQLAKKIPPKFIKTLPTGYAAKYTGHAVIQQYILSVLGPTPQRVDQIIYNGETITGVLLTMTFTIDDKIVEITEVGSVDRPKPDANGENLKMCISDSVKRCSMRVGKGLQLWCEEEDQYVLDEVLAERAEDATAKPFV